MLLYCIIMWLFGIGVFMSVYKQEKEEELFEKGDIWGYLVVWAIFPILLPVIAGYTFANSKYKPEKDDN